MANNTNNNTLTTDFNVSPYYDDYNENNQYYRILYKPGYAVQARELTQSQTILQKQINRIGKHLFKEGSIVIPGAFSLEAGHCEANGEICIGDSISYVRVKDVDTTNTNITISNFNGEIVTGLTNYVKAYIADVVDGTETSSNTKTIFVRYLTTSNVNTEIKTFTSGETLVTNTGTLIVLANNHVAGANSIGLGSRFEIESGVFFAKEHFISFPKQSIILDRYNHIPSCKVGFLISEEIIRYSEDQSLLDPALESSNYSAPGADRLKLTPKLFVTSYDDTIGPPDFVTLFTLKEGRIQTIFERTQYNILQDEIAKRTYDESGDYFVYGAGVQIREHDDTGTNFGKYANGNNQLLFVGVDPGLLYVKGYEVGVLDTVSLETSKSLSYDNVNSQISTTSLGSYVRVNELTGTWELDVGKRVNLYDESQKRITNKKWSVSSQTGNNIGSAILSSLEYSGGIEGYNAEYNVYLSDIRMIGSNSFSSVKSLYIDNASVGDAGADTILDTSNNAILEGLTESAPLYYVGSDYTRNIKTADDPAVSDTTFNFNRSEGISSTIQIQTTGLFSISIPSSSEIFPYGTGTLSNADKRDIRVSLNQSFNVAMTGTVSGTAGTKDITGLGTFFTRLNVGDKIEINGKSNTFYITSITNNTQLSINENLPVGISGNSFYKAYKTGDIIDLTSKGYVAGTVRSVTSTPTQLSFNMQETYSSAIGATVTYQLSRTSAREVQKILKPNRFVIINCSTAGTTGPFNLGFSDIYQIRAITLKNSSAPTSTGDGTDVLKSFIIDRGQRDTHYDHGSITPKSSISLTSSSYLLVELDYFEPNFTSRVGYFSIDSYPIQDNDELSTSSTIRTENIPVYRSPISGKEYDLRNYLDFRPVKTITATDTTNPASASVNPAISTTYNYSTGLRFPAPSTQLTYDYSYYLARKDIVVVDKDKNFSIIKGVPAVVPITPVAQKNLMTLAVLEIPPYPSLSPAYAKSIGKSYLSSRSRRVASPRFTMRDIGVLKERIVNLEYYTTLSLLEKQAADLRITDENGLDRFKNGIFVDTFRDHLLGATYNQDYRITVDPIEKSIRPLYTMDSYGYDYVSGTNVAKSNDIITMTFTEVPVVTQTSATTIRNIERSSYRFLGNMTLIPDQDVWVNTTFADDESVQLGPTLDDIGTLGVTPTTATAYALVGPNVDIPGPELVLTTEWGAWRKYATGYNVFQGSGANKTFIGTYGTYDAARNAANRFTNNTDATIETVFNNIRTGTEQFLTELTDSATLDYKIIDTSVVPYIRSQTIAVKSLGLKPFTKMFTFFDNEKVDNYVTPITKAEYDIFVQSQTTPTIALAPSANEGDDLIVSETGELFFLFRIADEKKWRVGSKSLVITDSPTNSEDATTGTRGFFNAQGLNVTKQKTILSTRDIIPLQREVEESYVSNQFEVIPRVVPRGGGGGGGCKSCLAYSFVAKSPANEEGIFLTSVDIFVAAKSPTRGIWFEIREMNNGGGITRNQVPFSEVWYTSDQVPISTDGVTNPLTVKFQAPIFLYNNVQYAFVIHTEGIDQDYYLHVSRLGEVDINTNLPVFSRALAGTLFTTQNNTNWDIVPDVDLTCIFRRASFTSGVQGNALIKNKPVDKFIVANVSNTLSSRIGDYFISGDTVTVSGANGTISITDRIRGNISSFNTNVISVISATQYGTEKTGFQTGEKIDVYYSSNGVYKGVSATITGIANAIGKLAQYTETSFSNKAVFINTNGKFKANDIIKSAVTGDSHKAQIKSIENFRYSVVSFEPSYIAPALTEILFEMKTYSNTGTEGSFVSIDPSSDYYFKNERSLYSRSREVSELSGASTNQVRINMLTTSEAVSPFVDLARTHNIYIDNIINSNATNETSSFGGELFNKYISRTVTLADGQDAEDIHVVLTSYRPPGTDVKVYIKILNAEDADTFANKNWIELEKTEATDPLYSSLSDRNDFKEFTYKFPASLLTGENGEVQYTNSVGTKFTGFKYFAIKIGLLDDNNSAVIPRVADLRCIALQI